MVNFFKVMLWFKLGALAGFVAAFVLNQTPAGRTFFSGLTAKLTDFFDGVSSGYRERDAELRSHAD